MKSFRTKVRHSAYNFTITASPRNYSTKPLASGEKLSPMKYVFLRKIARYELIKLKSVKSRVFCSQVRQVVCLSLLKQEQSSIVSISFQSELHEVKLDCYGDYLFQSTQIDQNKSTKFYETLRCHFGL